MNKPNLYTVATALAGENTVKFTTGNNVEFFPEVNNPPTMEEINAELVRLQTEYDKNKYQRDRRSDYPDIGDQLDALYHAGAFPEDMAAKLKAVKEKHPKP